MAGRKAHIDNTKFDEFLESIPEESRGQGYWKIKRETQVSRGGGVIQSIMGFIEFKLGEDYDSLRERIKEMALIKGPGVYFALPCDQNKKEIKSVDMARFEYKEQEVPMPEPAQQPETSPLSDTLKTIKRTAKDMNDIQQIEIQKRLMEKFLGDDGKKKEDDDVKEEKTAGGGMNDILMYKMLFNDDSKKSQSAQAEQTMSTTAQQLQDAKLTAALSDVKSTIAAMQAQMQMQAQKPADDGKLERLLDKIESQRREDNQRFERLLEKITENKAPSESPFQSMMAMMAKDAAERDRIRQEEERKRDESRREEERKREESRREEARRADDLKRADDLRREQERKEEERRHTEEQKRYDDTKKAEETKREDEKKRYETEKKEETRRADDLKRVDDLRREQERKEEAKRLEEQIKLERDHFTQQIVEERRRFDEELKLRRDEMKQEHERGRTYASEQQKYQLQLFELVRENKNSGLDMTAKIVETLTGAGLTSMKTAQEAAESIMSIAKKVGNVDKDKDKESGLSEILKGVGEIAGPLLAPYADADAKLRMLKSASKMNSNINKRSVAQEQAAMETYQRQQMAQQQQQQMAQQRAYQEQMAAQAAQAQRNTGGTAQGPTGLGSNETISKPEEGFGSMITQLFKNYPIIKDSLVDSLKDGVGPEIFIEVVLGANNSSLDGLVATLGTGTLMRLVKDTLTEDEKKLVDGNEPWFKKLKLLMIEEIKQRRADEAEDDDDDEPEGGGIAPTVPAPDKAAPTGK